MALQVIKMEGYIDEYGHPKVVVMVNGLSMDAVVYLTESEETLLGTQMFFYLETDFDENRVRIE